MNIKSSVRDVLWPAIVLGEGSTLLAMAFQLERSQWWPAGEIEAHQYRQLSALLRHAGATVPFYRQRLAGAGLTGREALTPERWRTIPLLTKQEIRRHRADLRSLRVPASHGRTERRKTSGSTGEPLEVLWTELSGFFWQGLNFRDDLWHGRDPGGRLVAIRSGRDAPDPLAVRDLPAGGGIAPSVCEAGPVTLLYHLTPIPRQVEILEARNPDYLLMYPSNARALCRYARRRPIRMPRLRAVQTYGEPLTPDVRVAVRETWGVPVEDIYSCEEVGIMALQCPRHEHHHVQSESVLVEILDDQGNPAQPGQIGRVVVTSLHSFAMPLIRYAIGDHAEVGEACPCGRGLPVLRRILGRDRNRVTLPDGRRTWPDIGALWATIPDAEQIQLVQRGPDLIEVRYARENRLSIGEEQVIGDWIRGALGHPFRLTFSGPEAIGRQPNGKYQTFVDPR